MQRIDGATAVPALPAPAAVIGTPGYFTKGDPSVPQSPTIVSADWANMIQEELVTVVLAAGITLSKSDHGQLLAAIIQVIGATIPFASDAEGIAASLANKAMTPHSAGALVTARINALINAAPGALDTLKELADALGDDPNFASTVNTALAARVLTSRTIAGGGLITGGGDGTANRTLTLNKATGAQVLAGTDDTVAVTPAGLAAGLPSGGTWDRGWTTLPGGFIEQWGSETITGSGTSASPFTLAFPKQFAAGCGSITGSCQLYAGTGLGEWHPLVVMFGTPDVNGVTGYIDSTDPDHPISGTRIMRWRATGQ
jgi:hypothetical protein